MATGMVRGTFRSALITKRGASLDEVTEKVALLLEKSGGNPYNGFSQALVIEARAV